MPMVGLQTSAKLSEEQKQGLLKGLSSYTAQTLGKPERYVMVVGQPASILMAGTDQPAAFVEVRSIGGLSGDVTRTLSAGICRILKEEAGIEGDCVYINFMDIAADAWGWNGSTFG